MLAEKKVTLRGEGGVPWTFALPLTETIQEQVEKGTLVPADEESAALLGTEDEELVEVEVKVSGAAAKLAEELGVDLSEVEGSGKGGSITKGDVEDAADAGSGDGDESSE